MPPTTPLRIIIVVCFALAMQSCSWDFYGYLINKSEKPAIIDVFLLDKSNMETLPNKVRIANRIIRFKPGYRRQFEIKQNVRWMTHEHFRLNLGPHSTTALTDMTGMFRNGSPPGNILVTLTIDNKCDTILYGPKHWRHDRFVFRPVGFTTNLLYYEITD